jgi:cell fate (sporulation/competence/biofilm development) regulator YmcA (YheA/YmcA/DUF963 family)
MANNVLDRNAIDIISKINIEFPQAIQRLDALVAAVEEMRRTQGVCNERLIDKIDGLRDRQTDQAAALRSLEKAIEDEPLKCPFRVPAEKVNDLSTFASKTSDRMTEHESRLTAVETLLNVRTGLLATLSVVISALSTAVGNALRGSP